MLDQVDRDIIKGLQKNGRRSYTDLAKMLGLSEGTIRNRLRKLEKDDVIKVSATVNPYALGFRFVSLMAMQVQMADLHRVAELLSTNPRVYYLAFVAGRYDVVAIMFSRTPEELSEFIKDEISSIPGIVRTDTMVNLEILKSPWITPWDISQLVES